MATVYQIVEETMTIMQTRMDATKDPDLREKLRQKYMQAATLHVQLSQRDALIDVGNSLQWIAKSLDAIAGAQINRR